MKMVCKLLAVAVAAEKQAKMNMGRRTTRRPYNSLGIIEGISRYL
jgi:hypothetical protein